LYKIKGISKFKTILKGGFSIHGNLKSHDLRQDDLKFDSGVHT